jgi:hypothetical protein
VMLGAMAPSAMTMLSGRQGDRPNGKMTFAMD